MRLDQLVQQTMQIDQTPRLGDQIGGRLVKPPSRGYQAIEAIE